MNQELDYEKLEFDKTTSAYTDNDWNIYKIWNCVDYIKKDIQGLNIYQKDIVKYRMRAAVERLKTLELWSTAISEDIKFDYRCGELYINIPIKPNKNYCYIKINMGVQIDG